MGTIHSIPRTEPWMEDSATTARPNRELGKEPNSMYGVLVYLLGSSQKHRMLELLYGHGVWSTCCTYPVPICSTHFNDQVPSQLPLPLAPTNLPIYTLSC